MGITLQQLVSNTPVQTDDYIAPFIIKTKPYGISSLVFDPDIGLDENQCFGWRDYLSVHYSAIASRNQAERTKEPAKQPQMVLEYNTPEAYFYAPFFDVQVVGDCEFLVEMAHEGQAPFTIVNTPEEWRSVLEVCMYPFKLHPAKLTPERYPFLYIRMGRTTRPESLTIDETDDRIIRVPKQDIEHGLMIYDFKNLANWPNDGQDINRYRTWKNDA